MSTEIEVKNYKLKALPNKPIPNAILYIKADGDSAISTYITDVNGIPYPLKDDGSITNPGVQTIFNTDGTVSIIGTTDVKVSIQSSILNTINSALQPGDLPNTKAEFNSQLSDGDFLFVGDVIPYTDEEAQEAVGSIFIDTNTIDITYDDLTPSISAIVKPNSITPTELADNINLTEFVNNAGFENTSQLNTRDINNRNRANHTGTQAISTVVNLQSSLDAKENKAEKNIANGYAGLDVNSKILKDQLPIRLVWGYITAINGGTRTITSDEDILSVDASTTIANYTINLPLSLTEAKEISVTFNVAVTNLTIGAGGVIDYYPTKAKVYDTYTWAYEPVGNQWIMKSNWSGDLGAQITALPNKGTITDIDAFAISDGSASSAPKKVTASNLHANYLKPKNDLLYLGNEPKPSKGLLIGDSTIASYAGGDGIETFLLEPSDILAGSTILNQAVPGNTINQQLTIYNADTNKATYDWVIVQVGLNDVLPISETATTAIARYQNLINTIYSTKKAGAKIIVSAMLPCKQRWIDVVGSTDGATAQAKWVAMNLSIMGGGATPVTNVDFRNNDHVETLSDGVGNLAKAFCVTPIDNIHENNNGRYVIASSMRKILAYADFFRPKTENNFSKYFTNVGKEVFLKEGVLKIDSRLNTGDYSLYLKNSNNGTDQYTQMSYEIMTTDGSEKQTFSTGVGNYSNGTVLTEKYYLFYNDFLGGSHFLFHVNKNGDFTNYGAIFAPRISVSSPNSNYAGFFEKTDGFGSALALKSSSVSSNSVLRFISSADTVISDVSVGSAGAVHSGTLTASPATVGTELATLNQVIAVAPISGTYSPTLTAIANCSGVTQGSCTYTRIGNLINVSVRFSLTDLALTTDTSFRVSLPVNRTSSASVSAIGSGVINSSNGLVKVSFDTANNSTAIVSYNSGTGFGSKTGYVNFQYLTTE